MSWHFQMDVGAEEAGPSEGVETLNAEQERLRQICRPQNAELDTVINFPGQYREMQRPTTGRDLEFESMLYDIQMVAGKGIYSAMRGILKTWESCMQQDLKRYVPCLYRICCYKSDMSAGTPDRYHVVVYRGELVQEMLEHEDFARQEDQDYFDMESDRITLLCTEKSTAWGYSDLAGTELTDEALQAYFRVGKYAKKFTFMKFVD